MIELSLKIVYWCSIAIIFWVGIGYPLVLRIIAGFCTRKEIPAPGNWPRVSLIIAAYNEEAVIEAKINNSLALDYPAELLEIIIASDASTDRTDELVKLREEPAIRLIRIEGRKGKTNLQNESVKQATGEVLVFSDANAMYDKQAIKKLVRHFSNSDVGCVEGRRLDYSIDGSATSKHELSFRDYESQIKVLESEVGSCTGATGPIYAIRKNLYIDLPESFISDLMEPILIRFRTEKKQIYEPEAISREEVLDGIGSEFKRKVRIITRCLHSITSVPGLLNPFNSGGFALQIWSHRLLRWMLPLFLMAILCSSFLLRELLFYRYNLFLHLLVLTIVAMGCFLDAVNLGPKVLRLPFFVFSVNLAAFFAITNWLRGKNVVVWEPDRKA